ncbi:MAG TPA: peptidylprolyl isomerase [Prolixibacteraceae bacterium]|nr:peptidylprolyl isomerase [Prolixibacteraceae bacterium]
MMRSKYLVGMVCLFLISCGSPAKKQSQKTAEEKTQIAGEEKPSNFADLVPSVFKINTYENDRILETGMGFFVTEDLAVTRLSFFESANRAVIEPLDETQSYEVSGYAGVDRMNDLILLQIKGLAKNPVNLTGVLLTENDQTINFDKPQGNTVPLHEGKVLSYSTIPGPKLYRITNQLWSKSAGSPVFNSGMQCVGLAFSQLANSEIQTFVTPSVFITDLLKKADKVQALSELQKQQPVQESQNNSAIKGLVIETDLGNIRIKLYNSTPQYRDNMIKLVREKYYDGLLIHRVIKDFCIQSGAADTRYAEADDVVGWKGPGYTLPAHIVPGLYHKRGVIGSPRKPDTRNSHKRSDGSQFYIVTGRTYSDLELNDLEKEMNHTFSKEQRNTYKTIGGAPHLDGTYTIFGEVVEGMDLADRISKVETGSDFRPKTDIRIKKIRILE